MIDQLNVELQQILAEIKLPEQTNIQEVAELLNRHMEEIEPIPSLPGAAEQIFVVLGEEGAIKVTTTIKIPNLKFKLGELLLETLKSTVKFSAAKEKPLAMLLVGIEFLQKIRQLSAIEIGTLEAEILLAIYKLIQEKERLTIDTLLELTRLSDMQVATSLDILEKLACIEVTDNEIKLNETIIVQHEM